MPSLRLPSLRLHGFFRSGTSHRTRIALNLKGLAYEAVPVNLRAGAHKDPAYTALHPQGLVPALETDEGVLIQSPAIIEYLEERWPTPPLLPAGRAARARARAMAALIGCDIHPINNLRVLNALRQRFGADEAAVEAWTATWIGAGFQALEAMLAADPDRGAFCLEGRPGVVECYLVPQVYSARRFNVDLSPFPLIVAVDAACAALPAIHDARPEAQPDAPQPDAG